MILHFHGKFLGYKTASRTMRTVGVVCFRFSKWIPVLFVVAVVAYSYYGYTVILCFHFVENIIERVVYLVIYHILFVMLVWSYLQTTFTPMGIVPENFKPTPAEAEDLESEQSEDNRRRKLEFLAKDLPVVCRTSKGLFRYCEKCHHIKPDRSHHCSVCRVCVLKMDHHCPWINNCVSYTNYKFFILFLGYTVLYCSFIFATSVRYSIKALEGSIETSNPDRFHLYASFFGPLMFGLSLFFLLIYHCYLISVNRSTLDCLKPVIFLDGPNKDGFDLGMHANFVEVFGENIAKWFLPVFSSLGNGVSFPTRYNMRNRCQSRLEDKVLPASDCNSPV